MSRQLGSAPGRPPAQGAGPEQFEQNLTGRHRTARAWHIVFQASTVIGIIVLTALLLNITNSAAGLVAIENTVDP